MKWLEITVESSGESAEAVTAHLLEAGCGGVAECGGNPRTITGFLPAGDSSRSAYESLEQALARLPEYGLPAPAHIIRRIVDDQDWAGAWKQHYRPLEIGKRLVIKPSWETYQGDPRRVVVELDPGMAFGTGGHATTRLCLEALEDYVKPGDLVADIGTGSGILSLAAAKLGAGRVLATDIDSLPRRIARENVRRAGLESVVAVLEMGEFDREAGHCDIVLANILADTVIELAPSVFDRLKPGGTFISSGIVEECLPNVLAGLEAAGFRHRETRSDEVWRAVVAGRPDADAGDATSIASGTPGSVSRLRSGEYALERQQHTRRLRPGCVRRHDLPPSRSIRV